MRMALWLASNFSCSNLAPKETPGLLETILLQIIVGCTV